MNMRIECVAAVPPASRSHQRLAKIQIMQQVRLQPWVLPLQSLSTAMTEQWSLDQPVTASTVSASHWSLHHRYASQLAMSWLQFDLSAHADTAAATRWAYAEVLNHLTTSNHPRLLKIWHYLPAINDGDGERENYRQFCLGRAQALDDQHITNTMPAATAIGIPASAQHRAGQHHAVFYWLSGVLAPHNIENPRQVSAWQYPAQYGPASPNFSRASLLRLEEQRLLLISGTASVTGHATAYPGDCGAQTDEMLLNLRSLIDAAGMPYVPAKMCLRVYLRHPQDWPLVLAHMQRAGFAAEQLLPLHGDICRSDLLVELDGVLLEAGATGTVEMTA